MIFPFKRGQSPFFGGHLSYQVGWRGIKRALTPFVPFRALPVMFVLTNAGGCSDDWNSGKTFEFPDVNLTIKTNPEPLQVGEDAQVSVLITDQEHVEMPGCAVRFRQFMHDMEMDQDGKYFDMKEKGKGVYEGKSGEFSMGGDWLIEFEMKCQSGTHTAQIPYHLEWPE